MGLIHSFIAAYIHTAHCLKSTKKVSFYCTYVSKVCIDCQVKRFEFSRQKSTSTIFNFQKLFQFKKQSIFDVQSLDIQESTKCTTLTDLQKWF